MIEAALAARPGDRRADAFAAASRGAMSVSLVPPDGAGFMGGEVGGRIVVVGQGVAPEPLFEADPGPVFVQFLECQPAWSRLPAPGDYGAGATSSPSLAPAAARFALGLAGELARGGPPSVPTPRERLAALAVDGGRWSAPVGVRAGIMGMGRVGESLALLLCEAGAEVAYADVRTARQGGVDASLVRRYAIDRLLVTSDVLFVAVPWGPGANPVIGRREISLLGGDALVVSISDPRVMDVDALFEAVAGGDIRGAALDFPCSPRFGDALRAYEHERFLVTRGLAGSTEASHRAAAEFAVRNILRFASGGEPEGMVEILDYPRAGDPAFWSSHMSPRSG